MRTIRIRRAGLALAALAASAGLAVTAAADASASPWGVTNHSGQSLAAPTATVTVTRYIRGPVRYVRLPARTAYRTVTAAAVPPRCTPVRPLDSSLLGGVTILTQVSAVRCGGTVWIDRVDSAGSSPYRVTQAVILRPMRGRWVVSAVVPVSTAASVSHPVGAWRQVPAAASGYSAAVKITLAARGRTRTIILHV